MFSYLSILFVRPPCRFSHLPYYCNHHLFSYRRPLCYFCHPLVYLCHALFYFRRRRCHFRPPLLLLPAHVTRVYSPATLYSVSAILHFTCTRLYTTSATFELLRHPLCYFAILSAPLFPSFATKRLLLSARGHQRVGEDAWGAFGGK